MRTTMFRHARAVSPIAPVFAPATCHSGSSAPCVESFPASALARQSGRDLTVRRPTRSIGKHFSATPTAAEHLLFLHGFHDKELIAERHIGIRRLSENEVAPKGFNHTYRAFKSSLSSLVGQVGALDGEEDVFVTQASFVWGSRNDPDRHRTRLQYVESIGVLFVDIDVYNSDIYQELNGCSKRIARAILEHCDRNSVVRPVLIHSGKGFYAYWVLEKRHLLRRNAKAITRWQQLQQRMVKMLTPFSPDERVKDTTRVLRLIGSINSKNGSPVSVAYDDGGVHSIESLEQQVASFPIKKSSSNAPKFSSSNSSKKKKHTKYSPFKPGIDKEKAQTNHSLVQPPSHVYRSIERLIALRDGDAEKVKEMGVFRRRYWNAFSDIVELIRLRKGLRQGQRDEMIFWMMITRHLSGLLPLTAMPTFSRQVSELCDTPLNIWKSGMLASLVARIQGQKEKKHLTSVHRRPRRTIIRSGSFGKCSYSTRSTAFNALYANSEFTQSLVYTPSYATLIEKLDITSDEQVHLNVLIHTEEKKRRAFEKSATAKRLRRNALVLEQVDSIGISGVISTFEVSRATAYRVTQSVRKDPSRNLIKARVYRLRAQGMSLRQIASNVNLPLSTISRWVKLHQQREQSRQFNHALARIALSSPTLPSSVFSSSTITYCVSLSQIDAFTIEGRLLERRKGHTELHNNTVISTVDTQNKVEDLNINTVLASQNSSILEKDYQPPCYPSISSINNSYYEEKAYYNVDIGLGALEALDLTLVHYPLVHPLESGIPLVEAQNQSGYRAKSNRWIGYQRLWVIKFSYDLDLSVPASVSESDQWFVTAQCQTNCQRWGLSDQGVVGLLSASSFLC